MRTSTLRLFVFSALVIALVIGMGHYNNFQGGYTGAPGELTCKTCHTIPTSGMSGGYMLEGLPTNLAGGQTYQLTMVAWRNNNICETAGFQMNFLNGDGTSHGQITESDDHVEINQFGNRSYVLSDFAPPFGGDNFGDTIYFPFSWTPEVVDMVTPVTSYFGVALGNGNYDSAGGQRGDTIYMGTRSLNIVPALTAEIMVLATPECNGGDEGSLAVTSNGGLAPITVQWSTGDNGTMLNNVPAGLYSATVSDAIGQQVVLQAEVTEPVVLSGDLTGTDPSCHNTSDGMLSMMVGGGTPPYAYQLDGQAITNPVFNLGPGTYMMAAIDANGCMISAEVTLEIPDSIEIELIYTTPQTAQDPGAIVIELSGGTTPYDFFWTGPNDYTGIQQNPQDLAAGDYFLTVTDANGCTKTFVATVEFASALNDVTSAKELLHLSPNPGRDDLQITFPEINGAWEIKCLNTGGHLVWNKVVEPADDIYQITQNWPPGVYVIAATHHDSGMTLTHRWIKVTD